MKLTVVLLVTFLILSNPVFSAMLQPTYGVNYETGECAEFFMGDECMNCKLPSGWERIDEFKCPSEYVEINIDSICTPLRDNFCCTIGHSGADGDCSDLVVNSLEGKCSFVSDCNRLPSGWFYSDNLCPSEYEWADEEISCRDFNIWLFIAPAILLPITFFLYIKKFK